MIKTKYFNKMKFVVAFLMVISMFMSIIAPVSKALSKKNADIPASTIQGNIEDLGGIEFTVRYYKGLHNTEEELAKLKPDAEAVFATNEKGFLSFAFAEPIRGEWKYKTEFGYNTVPLGTLYVKENEEQFEALRKRGIDMVNKKTVGRIIHYTDGGDMNDPSDVNHTVIKEFPTNLQDNQAENASLANGIVLGAVGAYKRDSERVRTDGSFESQGDATLKGAVYDVYNNSKHSIFMDGKEIKSLKNVDSKELNPKSDTLYATMVPTDKKDGQYYSELHEVPFGTYIANEKTAPEGYLVGPEGKGWTQEFTIKDENIVKLDSLEKANLNQVKRGGVMIRKVDRETDKATPLGAASLEGASFEIVNKSKNPVYYKNEDGSLSRLYQPGEVVATIVAKWDEAKKEFIARTPEKALPYGTYEIREVGVGEGYLLNKEHVQMFKIREDGKMVENDVNGKQLKAKNQVKREDFRFNKVDDSLDHDMPYVVFTVTSSTTGEKHVIVTDKNGTFNSDNTDTELKKHSQRTNANDPYEDEKGNIINPNSNGAMAVDKDGNWYVKDANKLDPNAGTYFTGIGPKSMEKYHINFKWNETEFVGEKGEKLPETDVDGKVKPDTQFELNSYTVNGNKVYVDDRLRAFPFDMYLLDEIRTPERKDTDRSGNINKTLITNERIYLKDYPTSDDSKQKEVMDIQVGHLKTQFTKFGVADKFEKLVPRYMYPNGKNFERNALRNKTIYIHTDLYYGDKNKVVPANSKVDLYDLVAIEHIKPNKEYTLKSELHKVKDGKDYGVIARGEKIFTSRYENIPVGKEIIVEFKNVDTKDLDGYTLVAYEYLYDNKTSTTPAAKHEDIDDKYQTIYVPEIGTSAMGDIEKESLADQTIKIVDKVSYKNLQPGKTYKMTGKLMMKDKNGKAVPYLDDNGKEVTAEKDFTVPFDINTFAKEGTVDITFEFSGVNLAGKSVVAFEKVLKDNIEFAVHEDIEDEEQTVHFPGVKTTAKDGLDGDKEVSSIGEQKVIDVVKASNLQVGKTYVVKGTLHIKDNEGKDLGVYQKDGKDYVVEKEFVADKKDMEVELEFLVDAESLQGKDTVVFEDLFRDGVQVGVHADIEDKDQTVHFPKIGTKLTNDTAENAKLEDKEITLIDTVKYENLQPGKEYRLEGELHKRTDGKDQGVIAKAKAKFTPKEKNGEAKVEFKFNAKDLTEKDQTVAFESLYNVETESKVAIHEDIEDEGQTIYHPGIKTTAYNAMTGEKHMSYQKKIQLKDVVKYTNLKPGREYTLKGELHVREDGKDKGVLKDAKGNKVVAEAKFTPITSEGETEIIFEYEPDMKTLPKEAVVFETLYDGKIEIAVHADIEDENQTVYFLGLKTTLYETETLSKTVKANADIKLQDKIEYKNLVPGKKYTMEGVLVDKNGKELPRAKRAKKEFVPETANGFVTVDFEINTSGMGNDERIIAFEYLKDEDDRLVGQHEDVEDKDQTVRVKLPVTPPATGIMAVTGIVLAIMIVALSVYTTTIKTTK